MNATLLVLLVLVEMAPLNCTIPGPPNPRGPALGETCDHGCTPPSGREL
jgi:hypothetical protein